MGNINTSETVYPSVYIIDEMLLGLYLEHLEVRLDTFWPRGMAFEYCHSNLPYFMKIADSLSMDKDVALLRMFNKALSNNREIEIFKFLFSSKFINGACGDQWYLEGKLDEALHSLERPDWVLYGNDDGTNIGVDRSTGLMLVRGGDSYTDGCTAKFNHETVVAAGEYDGSVPSKGVWDSNIPNL